MLKNSHLLQILRGKKEKKNAICEYGDLEKVSKIIRDLTVKQYGMFIVVGQLKFSKLINQILLWVTL